MSANGGRVCGAGAALLLSTWMLGASAEPLPEFYGFYAVDNGRLIELKASSTDTLSVGPDVRFINFAKGGYGGGDAHVSRMLFLRNRIDPDANPAVKAENRWYISADTTRDVELRGKPIPGQSEMMMLVPREPLKEGAYTVVINKAKIAGFFVNRESLAKNLQASADCVDHVYEGMGDEFSWDKMDQRMAGKHQVVVCSQSQPMSGAGAGPSGAAVNRSTGTSAGEAAAAPAINKDALAAQLTALMQRSPVQPEQPDKTSTREKLGVSFAYPADWELIEDKIPIFATIALPGDEKSLADRTQITLTRSDPRQAVRLQEVVTSTIEGTRKTLTNATIAGPVSTQMCGAEAQTFLVTGTEAGKFRQKAVTVAVSNGAIVGAILHATPETFEAVWDSYQRVKNSYAVTQK